jgi:hypothetical protein
VDESDSLEESKDLISERRGDSVAPLAAQMGSGLSSGAASDATETRQGAWICRDAIEDHKL